MKIHYFISESKRNKINMFKLIKVLFVLVLIPLNLYSKSCELFETIETPSNNINKSFLIYFESFYIYIFIYEVYTHGGITFSIYRER